MNMRAIWIVMVFCWIASAIGFVANPHDWVNNWGGYINVLGALIFAGLNSLDSAIDS